MDHQDYIQRTLYLAQKARGQTSPNPLVGAVVVKDGLIVGEGYHRKAGEPHAEILALEQAGEKAEGATLYCNLEPCTHYGRTPPCYRAIIDARIKEVVVAVEDPNPLVSGKGIENLREHDISVISGILEEEARRVNEVFFKYISTKMPFVIMKIATSLDGKMATYTGDSKWISNEASRSLVHQWRSEVDAVVVGVNTIIKDDPLLTSRLVAGRNPKRVIVDSRLRIPTDSKVLTTLDEAPTILATTSQASSRKVSSLESLGVEVLVLPEREGLVSMMDLMGELGKKEITSLLLEGGASLIAAALDEGVVDKVYFFLAPKLIGGKEAPGPIGGQGVELVSEAILLCDVCFENIDSDILVSGYIKKCSQG
ncbi:MAG: bifunctional diaminohydroxyphosphoribosylaminopyrimidine deaminase/5-amino-6-(5-phosphoribosylamino)uracil reductase RibD [Candidatus Tectomicrobia bacterium]|uniref:Riboflavin biosynthesis protein RibD n=1 Tax=Tectimicrobiota bacterium TaxID=2528274 RepID=A0A933LQZ9_UNCTE|nr:bifunctional diaminohydroxyphosphoribosylaminopyrimidine deaminase/5-amino-6-(5-phosphoribosylamino)uracil reductase RibD [Candidatus Tectomicrobia bacterium]